MAAPIVLFAYNRPDHTRRTIEALSRNELASESPLFIYSDGPKNDAAAAAVEQVRAVCADIQGFASVKVICAPANQGLARSIIDGVTSVVNEYGRVVVVEDDLVTSPYFLRFMNEALDRFEHDERVMHVSGATYPIDTKGLPDCYFLKIPLCWGWGTWKRAWAHFEKDIGVMDKFDKPMRDRFNFNNSHDYWGQLERNKSGEISTWFIFWYAVLFLRGGLSLFPRQSMVRNIGFDGSGVHCGTSQVYTSSIVEVPGYIPNDLKIEESELAYRRHTSLFNSVGHSRRRRWLEMVRKWFGFA